MASMRMLLSQSFDRGERRRLAGFFGSVGLLHIAGWGLLLVYAASHPAFLALGGLAYTFGLRHAFDADHISAIDNTTRKLLQSGKKPVGVGFFFSLGHSTVVLLIAVALGLAVKSLVQGVVGDNGELRNVGGAVGTLVSGGFLVLIGVLNLVILIDIVRVYRQFRRREPDPEGVLQPHGDFAVSVRRLVRGIGRARPDPDPAARSWGRSVRRDRGLRFHQQRRIRHRGRLRGRVGGRVCDLQGATHRRTLGRRGRQGRLA